MRLDAPVTVRVNLYVRSISNVDDAKMVSSNGDSKSHLYFLVSNQPYRYFWFQEYSLQIIFREQWVDERLKFDDDGGKRFSILKLKAKFLFLL